MFFFTQVTESLLCSVWAFCIPVWRLCGRIAVLSKASFSTSGEKQTHEHWSE